MNAIGSASVSVPPGAYACYFAKSITAWTMFWRFVDVDDAATWSELIVMSAAEIVADFVTVKGFWWKSMRNWRREGNWERNL